MSSLRFRLIVPFSGFAAMIFRTAFPCMLNVTIIIIIIIIIKVFITVISIDFRNSLVYTESFPVSLVQVLPSLFPFPVILVHSFNQTRLDRSINRSLIHQSIDFHSINQTIHLYSAHLFLNPSFHVFSFIHYSY